MDDCSSDACEYFSQTAKVHPATAPEGGGGAGGTAEDRVRRDSKGRLSFKKNRKKKKKDGKKKDKKQKAERGGRGDVESQDVARGHGEHDLLRDSERLHALPTVRAHGMAGIGQGERLVRAENKAENAAGRKGGEVGGEGVKGGERAGEERKDARRALVPALTQRLNRLSAQSAREGRGAVGTKQDQDGERKHAQLRVVDGRGDVEGGTRSVLSDGSARTAVLKRDEEKCVVVAIVGFLVLALVGMLKLRFCTKDRANTLG